MAASEGGYTRQMLPVLSRGEGSRSRLFLSLGQGSGWLAQYTLRLNPKEIAHMDPSILLSLDSTVRRARLSEIRQIIDSPVATQLWADIRAAAVRERDLEPYLVDSVFPGRDEYSAQLLGMDYTLCRAVGLRILRHALMFLVDEDQAWLEAALRQAQVLFDDAAYPAWNHRARMTDPEYDVHLRTGMLAKDVGVMLNWLRPHLDVGQLESIVMGLDKRAVRPFQEAIQTDPWWIGVNNNWLTCIVGGLGVCGMALDELHPEARNLIDFADPLMERHLQDFGAAGEFNEGLGYAGAVALIVDYFTARMGWAQQRENRLAAAPFPDIGRFFIHMCVPPGHLFAFGDGQPRGVLKADWMVAVAAACQDGVLQEFALRHRTSMADPLQLLCLDPDLEPASAQGVWPLGRAYHEHGALISSRSSWDPNRTASVVGSKARREDNHEHNDPGQVVIDGAGQPLIVDWGTPPTTYPAGFFTLDRFRYFEAQAYGHNIPVFGGRDMRSCYVLHPDYTEGPLHGKRALRAQGHIVESIFDDHWGGMWKLDTTAAWDGVKQCLRTVLHVFPGFVVVLDDIELDTAESISLRWNTGSTPTRAAATGDSTGARKDTGIEVHDFFLQRESVRLSARVLSLDGDAATSRIGRHGYQAPWNLDQFGGVLPERDCPFFETLIESSSQCRLLSLFAVQPGSKTKFWTEREGRHVGVIGDQELEVVVPGAREGTVTVCSSPHRKEWVFR
jgi:hypothetical protein